MCNFDKFRKRIGAVGLQDVEILNPICYFDMSYFDYCVLGGGKLTELEEAIQKTLHPKYEMTYSDYCQKYDYQFGDSGKWEKWVNAKCDVF